MVLGDIYFHGMSSTVVLEEKKDAKRYCSTLDKYFFLFVSGIFREKKTRHIKQGEVSITQ